MESINYRTYNDITILIPQKYVSRAFVLVWQLAQPLLFALIGAEINFSSIRPSLVGEWNLL